MKKEEAIFSCQRIKHHNLSSNITGFCVSNNILLICLENECVVRIPLQAIDKQTEIRIESGIRRAFLDPTSNHSILIANNYNAYYLHGESTSPKLLKGFKGHVITAVGWNRHYTESQSTSFILIGTKDGALYETEISFDGEIEYFVQIRMFTREQDPIAFGAPVPILSISMGRCYNSSTKDEYWLALIATPGQLHSFQGKIDILAHKSVWYGGSSSLAMPSAIISDKQAITLQLFESNSTDRKRVRTLDPNAANESPSIVHVLPVIGDEAFENFAWHTAVGIIHGKIDAHDPIRITAEDMLYSFPKAPSGLTDMPFYSALTDFHMLLLYDQRLTAVSILDHSVAYEYHFGKKLGKIVGLVRDPVSQLVWMCTENAVIKFKPEYEHKHIWRGYLARGDFENARRFAGDNRQALDIVLRKHAEALFAEGKLTSAAEKIAATSLSIESAAVLLMNPCVGGDNVSAKFISVSDARRPLMTYLQKKLDMMDVNVEKAAGTMLVLWLLELYLSEIADSSATNSSSNNEKDYCKAFIQRHDVMECLRANQKSVYALMHQHGHSDIALFFANLVKDYQQIVEIQMYFDNYDEAIAALTNSGDITLFRKYATRLFKERPKEFVDMCCNQKEFLTEIVILLPQLYALATTESLVKQLIQLVTSVRRIIVDEESLKIIDNTVFSLYCMNETLRNQLPKYIAKHTALYIGSDAVYFELAYALRMCKQNGLLNCCITIYCALKLPAEAIDACLKIGDVNEAIKCAELAMKGNNQLDSDFTDLSKFMLSDDISQSLDMYSADFSDNIRIRNLWLPIAKHIIDKTGKIDDCLGLISASQGALRVQHLLPLFPDFVTIESFKDPLCTCLSSHSGKVGKLKREMREAEEIATDIRDEIEKNKEKYVVHKARVQCVECGELASLEPFYAFPCTHIFHANCLKRLLEDTDRGIDEQCPLCGDPVIEKVDAPLLNEDGYFEELDSWL